MDALFRDRVVIKFGGADLSDGTRIRKAARLVVESGYRKPVVVVSAMGKTTDGLVETIADIDVSAHDYAEIVSMGERTSARVFCSALKALDKDARYFEPTQKSWPIITDSNFTAAIPDLERTRERVKKYVEPGLGKLIPVVCGFLGRDVHGNITTLGRGGSDITALLLGNALEANEVILVKDTGGVLSADPALVPAARPFRKLDIHDMFALTHGGGRIVRHEALRYKLPAQRLRIVSFSAGNLAKGGTEITGHFSPNTVMITTHRGLSAITVVGKINTRNMSAFLLHLRGSRVLGVSTGKNSTTVFGKLSAPKQIVNRLHALGRFKAVSLRNGIGMIEATHPIFVDTPGWVARLTTALAAEKINLIEVTTGEATINLFVDESSLDTAMKVASAAAMRP